MRNYNYSDIVNMQEAAIKRVNEMERKAREAAQKTNKEISRKNSPSAAVSQSAESLSGGFQQNKSAPQSGNRPQSSREIPHPRPKTVEVFRETAEMLPAKALLPLLRAVLIFRACPGKIKPASQPLIRAEAPHQILKTEIFSKITGPREIGAAGKSPRRGNLREKGTRRKTSPLLQAKAGFSPPSAKFFLLSTKTPSLF